MNLYDERNSHFFLMIGNTNLSEQYTYPYTEDKAYILELSKYKELLLNYRKDPASKIRMRYLSGKIPDQKDHNGNSVSGLDVVNRVEKSLKEKISKNNNIIEIDLLKN